MRHFFLATLTLFFFFDLSPAWGYPEFIGYKYASCLTCHFNGHGGGALNDYGRALWATEIAARPFTKGQTDEQVAASSGFLGKKELPWWIRPGFKLRQLVNHSNPGSKAATTVNVLMQADANVALFFNQAQSIIFVGSYGYAPVPKRFRGLSGEKPKEWVSREHYFRFQMGDSWYAYLGMMDKPYGIRVVNHTAYSRARTGLAQNDQAHGATFQYVGEKWESSLNLFAGNLFQDEELRQKGVSGIFDYAFDPELRVGLSVLSSSNKYVANTRTGVQVRAGQGQGSSILIDMGLISDKPIHLKEKKGYYVYSQATQKLFRGYHLFVTGQAFKEDMIITLPDYIKFGFGFLTFPTQKAEFRLEAESTRKNTTGEVQADIWSIMAQLHLAL